MGKEVELNEDPIRPIRRRVSIDRFHAPGLWYRDVHDDDHDDGCDGYSDMPSLEGDSDTDTEEYFNHREPKFCVEHGHCFGFHIIPLEGAPSVFLHGVFLVSHLQPP